MFGDNTSPDGLKAPNLAASDASTSNKVMSAGVNALGSSLVNAAVYHQPLRGESLLASTAGAMVGTYVGDKSLDALLANQRAHVQTQRARSTQSGHAFSRRPTPQRTGQQRLDAMKEAKQTRANRWSNSSAGSWQDKYMAESGGLLSDAATNAQQRQAAVIAAQPTWTDSRLMQDVVAFNNLMETYIAPAAGVTMAITGSILFAPVAAAIEVSGYALGASVGISAESMAAVNVATSVVARSAVVGGAGLAAKMGLWGRNIAKAENIAINASSPSEIAWGYGNLSGRQSQILESLGDSGDFLQLHKSHISPTDLAALTAHTGDEFALFTLGSRRIVVRGNAKGLRIDDDLSKKLLSQNWRWSAHTHPGLSDNVLMASGTPGDRQALQMLNQSRSLILNSAGRRSIFDSENDYAITNQTHYSTFRPGY